MVVAGEPALVGCVGAPVVPHRCSQGKESLGDAGADSLAGASTVTFQAELAFQRVEHRLDPLSDPAQVAVAGAFVAPGAPMFTIVDPTCGNNMAPPGVGAFQSDGGKTAESTTASSDGLGFGAA